MFICRECLKEHFENEELFPTTGSCQMCKKEKVCSEIPDKYLIPKIDKTFHETTK
jgi:hypothetical protein